MKKTICIILMLLLFTTVALAENPLQQEVLSHYPIASQEPVTLHIGIMNNNNRFNALLEAAFLAKYPNATIEYQAYTAEQVDVLLLGGIAMPDLLLCTSIVMDKLANQEMLLDIYKTGFIDSWPDEWIDISAEMEINGSLYGLPVSINQYYWMWNNALAEKSGAKLPDYPYSWDEFVEMAAKLQYDFDSNGIRDMQLLQGNFSSNECRKDMIDDSFMAYLEAKMLEHRELANGATFCTDEFQHLLDLYKKMLEIRGTWTAVPSFRGEAAYLVKSLGMSDSFFFNDGVHSVVLPPTLDKENPSYLGMADVAAIPVKSSNPDLALAFCQGMLDPELNSFYTHLERFFFKTMPKCYVVAEYPQMDINGGDISVVTSNTLQPDTWEFYEIPITQKEFDMYTYSREHVLLETLLWKKLSSEWETCLTGYLNGTFTFEQMTNQLDMALDMMLNE